MQIEFTKTELKKEGDDESNKRGGERI